MEITTKWYKSQSMRFLVVAGFMAPTAFFCRIDDWYGIGKDLFHMFAVMGCVYALNVGVYFSIERGKANPFMLNWLNQAHFLLSLLPVAALLYYGHLTSALRRTNYSSYPALRGRLSGVIAFAEIVLGLGGVVFALNILQSVIRKKRSRT